MTFHEIHSVGETFGDLSVSQQLPFNIMQGVTIEDVSGWVNDESAEWIVREVGTESINTLKNIRVAVVHRYVDETAVIGSDEDEKSRALIIHIVELLHIVRPMRQQSSLMRGQIDPHGHFRLVGFDVPAYLEVPEVQQFYYLRVDDLRLLKTLAPIFLQVMNSPAMKFRMAVIYHRLGRMARDGNVKYLLWCSAIEALFTSHGSEHQGKMVATERIKWFLGSQTPIYNADDFPDFVLSDVPDIRLAEVVGSVYDVRNFIAHGDPIPTKYFETSKRKGMTGKDISLVQVLGEALSFIVRRSLLKIVQDGLIAHFTDAPSADAYFTAHVLTKSILKNARKPSPYLQ
jgi:hypothetical protein